MATFNATSEALTEWQANMPHLMGQNLAHRPTVGVHSNVMLGDVLFDSNEHDLYDVNPDALDSVASDELYVTEVLPEESLAVNLVIDSTSRDEHPLVSRGKKRLAKSLATAIDHSLPGAADQIFRYRIYSEKSKRGNLLEETIFAPDSETYSNKLGQLATSGALTFLFTDGRGVQLEPGTLRTGTAVAIKFNHHLERRLIAGRGVVSLFGGGGGETDTSNPRKLAEKNAELQEQHKAIVESLRASGMAVAEVVNAMSALGYDIGEADKSIARAIRSLIR